MKTEGKTKGKKHKKRKELFTKRKEPFVLFVEKTEGTFRRICRKNGRKKRKDLYKKRKEKTEGFVQKTEGTFRLICRNNERRKMFLPFCETKGKTEGAFSWVLCFSFRSNLMSQLKT